MEKCLSKTGYDKSKSTTNANCQPAFTHSNLPFQCSSSPNDSSSISETLRFPSMRVTSIPTNTEVRLPDPLNTQEEMKLQGFRNEIMKITSDYIKENCDKKGRQ